MHFAHASAAYQAGVALYERRELQAAEDLLSVALIAFPDDGELLQLQGLIWHAQQRFTSACRALEMASSLVPLKLASQLVLADCYRRCQKRDTAQVILSYLATRTDMDTELLPELSSGLGRIGDYSAALEVCREAARRKPDCDESLYGMAFYMIKLGLPDECVLPLLHRALSLAPDCQLYRLSVAMLSLRMGRTLDAYEHFSGVAPDQVCCSRGLEMMIRTFDYFGDHERRDACYGQLLHLARLSETAGSDETTLHPTDHND